MAKLDAEDRKELPKEEFGEPAKKKYPMPDASHAGNAKGRAKQMLRKGVISQKQYDQIVAKANKVEAASGESPKKMPKPKAKSETDEAEDQAAAD